MDSEYQGKTRSKIRIIDLKRIYFGRVFMSYFVSMLSICSS